MLLLYNSAIIMENVH